jgi:hypothetical protein
VSWADVLVARHVRAIAGIRLERSSFVGCVLAGRRTKTQDRKVEDLDHRESCASEPPSVVFFTLRCVWGALIRFRSRPGIPSSPNSVQERLRVGAPGRNERAIVPASPGNIRRVLPTRRGPSTRLVRSPILRGSSHPAATHRRSSTSVQTAVPSGLAVTRSSAQGCDPIFRTPHPASAQLRCPVGHGSVPLPHPRSRRQVCIRLR